MNKTRIATGVLAFAVGASGLVLAYIGPEADVTQPVPDTVEGSARAVSLACPPDFEKTMGEMTAGIGGEDSDTLLRTRVAIVSGGDATLDGTLIKEGDGEVRTFFEGGAYPGELRVEPGETPALASGASQRIQESGELAGMAITPCLTPERTQYLVGGSTSASSSAQLVLTNVTGSPATVSVEIHTSTGTAEPSILSSTTVDAYSSEVLLVEAGVRDPRLALEITSSGGDIAAQLLTHEVDGIVGAGMEAVNPGTEPSEQVVIPGANLSGEEGVTLRVANPNTESATISIASITSEGKEPVPGSEDVTLAPGTVLDLSMNGLAGDWSALRVDSDQPVLAGARVDAEGDYAWLPSTRAVTNGAVTIPESQSQLTLYSESDASATVTFYSRQGDVVDSSTIDLAPIATITAPEDASHAVVESDGVHVGVLSTAEIDSVQGIAGQTLTPAPAGSADLTLQVNN
ncbi:DUF5719 family protein [Flaviflexus massiliensis]|uniref:DUF5719 family protein n=1 Tax=Flaviflexus massiliensis TaxID=1522309 RepID=UPI0006D579D9|nr:DUF5719 family protein [Flaviflexus massiliensis]